MSKKENSSWIKKGERKSPKTEFKKGQPSAFKGRLEEKIMEIGRAESQKKELNFKQV